MQKKKKDPNFTFLVYFAITGLILPRKKMFYYNFLALSKKHNYNIYIIYNIIYIYTYIKYKNILVCVGAMAS